MSIKKTYKGSDLSPIFVSNARKNLKKLEKQLIEKGCTNIDFRINFNYVTGFLTAPSGQIWYISSQDADLKRYFYRTAKSYSDYTGGTNIWDNNLIQKIK
jgi:hypothetical protein